MSDFGPVTRLVNMPLADPIGDQNPVERFPGARRGPERQAPRMAGKVLPMTTTPMASVAKPTAAWMPVLTRVIRDDGTVVLDGDAACYTMPIRK